MITNIYAHRNTCMYSITSHENRKAQMEGFGGREEKGAGL